jgi:hypothetical protein
MFDVLNLPSLPAPLRDPAFSAFPFIQNSASLRGEKILPLQADFLRQESLV